MSETLKREARLVRDAVRCFRRGGRINTAVDALVEAGEVCAALQLLKDEHKYDRALEILDAHPHLQVPPDLSAHAFLRQAAAALGLVCRTARRQGEGGGGGTGGGERRQRSAARAEEAARRAKQEEAETAFLRALERLPAMEGHRLLRRYGFHDVLHRKLLADRDFLRAAQHLFQDGKGGRAVALLLALPSPGVAELRLAALISTHLAFAPAAAGKGEEEGSAAGAGAEEKGEGAVGHLGRAAEALGRLLAVGGELAARGAPAGGRSAGDEKQLLEEARLLLFVVKFELALRGGAAMSELLDALVVPAEELGARLATAFVLQARALVCVDSLSHQAQRAAEMPGAGGQSPFDEVDVDEGTLGLVVGAVRALEECLRAVCGQTGRDEAEMRRVEALLGLSRSGPRHAYGGALAVSKLRLLLLRSILSHGETCSDASTHSRGDCEELRDGRLGTAPYGEGGRYGGCVPALPWVAVPASEARQEVLLDAHLLRYGGLGCGFFGLAV